MAPVRDIPQLMLQCPPVKALTCNRYRSSTMRGTTLSAKCFFIIAPTCKAESTSKVVKAD
jgi:hypothetical protein